MSTHPLLHRICPPGQLHIKEIKYKLLSAAPRNSAQSSALSPALPCRVSSEAQVILSGTTADRVKLSHTLQTVKAMKIRNHSMTSPVQPVVVTGGLVKGYAALSQFMDTSTELGVVRRFGALHYRNLLYLQDELMELEERLGIRDSMAGEHGCRRRDQDQVRAGLMQQLRVKLRQYGASWSIRTAKTVLEWKDTQMKR